MGPVSIEDRPAIVDQNTRLGDWEADTLIGTGHQGVLVTLAEPVSQKTLIARVQSQPAQGVAAAIISVRQPENDRLHTSTFDHGKAFAQHLKIRTKWDAESYVAHPYHSWERGLRVPLKIVIFLW